MKKLIIIPLLLFISIVSFSQIVLTIEGNTYTNSSSTWSGVNIPRTALTTLTFRNNSITSINTSSYMLQCGDDDANWPGNMNLPNARIFGNKLN